MPLFVYALVIHWVVCFNKLYMYSNKVMKLQTDLMKKCSYFLAAHCDSHCS